jgi:hypothetical protein
LTKEGLDAIIELMDEKKILLNLCGKNEKILYLIDGICLDLPIITNLCDYKTPHWSPVLLNVVK